MRAAFLLFVRLSWILGFTKGRLASINELVIALLDYGSGNLRSVHKALLAAGAKVGLVRDPGDIAGGYLGMVLPGVGAFDDCVSALRKQGLWSGVLDHIRGGKWFLGICVGYQVLFEQSHEFQWLGDGKDQWERPAVGEVLFVSVAAWKVKGRWLAAGFRQSPQSPSRQARGFVGLDIGIFYGGR